VCVMILKHAQVTSHVAEEQRHHTCVCIYMRVCTKSNKIIPACAHTGECVIEATKSYLIVHLRVSAYQEHVPADTDCPNISEDEGGKTYNKIIFDIFHEVQKLKLQVRTSLVCECACGRVC